MFKSSTVLGAKPPPTWLPLSSPCDFRNMDVCQQSWGYALVTRCTPLPQEDSVTWYVQVSGSRGIPWGGDMLLGRVLLRTGVHLM